MDIQRTPAKRRITRNLVIGALLFVAIAVTFALAQVRPASPPVKRSAIMTDTVRRTTFLRTVRGSGRLLPQESRWTAAATNARVERIFVEPGTTVRPDTVLIELSDPQQQQQAVDAQWRLRAAEADYESLRASLEVERLNQQAANAALRAEYESAHLRTESDAQMAKEGIVADLTLRVSRTNSESLGRRLALDDHRLDVTTRTLESRLAAQKAEVEQRRALHALMASQVDALRVRAGIDGVLQEISVEVGQRVPAGATLARVVQPDRLKAEIRVAEAQARDLRTGQTATIDTYNGKVRGVISRIDPAAREGSVTVDVRLTEPLPAGARPDLTVEGVIELGRLEDALQVARPAGVQGQSSRPVFRLSRDGESATRVPVTFGQSSADSIQITSGLEAGDTIVVSDSSAWNKYDSIEIE